MRWNFELENHCQITIKSVATQYVRGYLHIET